MKPGPFEMVRPRTLADAIRALSENEDAKVIAGGQSLVPLMNLRMATPAVLVDLSLVGELAGISQVEGELRIGAMTRQKDLLDNALIESCAPLVAAAMPFVGHVQTRNRGTVGGSLAHADPAAELPLVAAALEATVIAHSVRGVRAIAAGEFFVDALTTALEPDEVVVEIRLPVAGKGARAAFREFSRRHGDFAIAAAGVQVDGRELKAAIGGVGPAPHVCRDLSAAFAAGARAMEQLGASIKREISLLQAQTDLQATGDYRRHLARVALTEALEKALA